MTNFWVRCCTDPKLFRIKQVDGVEEQVYGDDGFFVSIPDLEPIPLTAEILEKNGFEELMNEGESCASRFGRTPKPTGVWQYGFGQFDSVAYVPERNFLRIK